MGSDASHVVEAVHNDSQYTVGTAAALIHLGLCNRPVTLPNLHDVQHILGASNFDLHNTHAHSAAPALGLYRPGSFRGDHGGNAPKGLQALPLWSWTVKLLCKRCNNIVL